MIVQLIFFPQIYCMREIQIHHGFYDQCGMYILGVVTKIGIGNLT